MADHFIIKSAIKPGELRMTGQAFALDHHAALNDGLTRLADSDIAALFATPMVGRNREGAEIVVSWYSDYSGTARPLASLDGALRADVAERLDEKLSVLRTLADAPTTDTELASLIDVALCVRSADDVLVIGGQPVLINWGVAPVSAMTDIAAMGAHIDATLGTLARPIAQRSISGAALPGFAGAAAAVTMAAPGGAGAEPQTADRSFASVPPAGDPRGNETNRDPDAQRRFVWWPPMVLIALMALILLWLLLPGTRLFPPPTTQVNRAIFDGALDIARQINRDLEERALALEAALNGAVCTPEGDLLMPDGRNPDGLLPPVRDGTAPTTEEDASLREGLSNPLIPPDPGRIQPKIAPGQDAPVDSLLTLVEPRTVLVLLPLANGTRIGTGFFITPDLVATNHHVIEEAISSGKVFVLNEALGAPQPATILYHDGPFEETGGDFAVLRIEGATAPYYSMISGELDVKSEAVMAAGYPSDIISDDLRFQRLLDGSSTEAPDLVVTSGIINSQQQITDTISILVHSASISQGNSGGPLVDLCGRVVGMNTFIREQSFRNLNLAQSMANLQGFLERSGINPTYATESCSPSIRGVPRPEPTSLDELTDSGEDQPEPEAAN